MKKKIIVTVLAVILNSGVAFADHPLIITGADTLDKGEVELALTGELMFDKRKLNSRLARERDVAYSEREAEAAATIFAGVGNNLEMEVEVPFVWMTEEREDGHKLNEIGLSDAEVSMKWRLYNEDALSFAFQPRVLLPTGDTEKDLGTGRISYGLMFLSTKKIAPIGLDVYLTIGLTHFDYKFDEDSVEARHDIGHASFAVQKEITKNIKVVADLGTETNPSKNSDTRPTKVIVGLIYAATDKLDIDFGIKDEITSTANHVVCLGGMKWKF